MAHLDPDGETDELPSATKQDRFSNCQCSCL